MKQAETQLSCRGRRAVLGRPLGFCSRRTGRVRRWSSTSCSPGDPGSTPSPRLGALSGQLEPLPRGMMRWVAPPIVEHAQGTVGLLDRHDEGRVVGGEGPPKADDEGGPYPPPIGGRAQGAIGLLHRVPQGGGCRPPLFFSRGSLGADRVAPLLHCQPRHLEVLPASRLGRLERPIEPLPLRFSRSPRMGSRTCAPASSLRAYIPATLRTIKELALLRRSGRQGAPRWRLHARIIRKSDAARGNSWPPVALVGRPFALSGPMAPQAGTSSQRNEHLPLSRPIY